MLAPNRYKTIVHTISKMAGEQNIEEIKLIVKITKSNDLFIIIILLERYFLIYI
ncbi:MAG: hypothetical protein ACLFQE_04825 [Thermotogota bacterium]